MLAIGVPPLNMDFRTLRRSTGYITECSCTIISFESWAGAWEQNVPQCPRMRQLACSRRANSAPEDSHTCDSSQFYLSRAFGHVQGTDSYSSDSFSISGTPAISHPAPVQASLQEAVRGTQCGGESMSRSRERRRRSCSFRHEARSGGGGKKVR